MNKCDFLKYNSYISNKKYRAVIRKADGTYITVKPMVYTEIGTNIAVADIAIAGIAKAG